MIKKNDYHTHNGYSGCAPKEPYSVKDGWNMIQEKGIEKYGISNHFPTRKEFGDYIPALKKEIDALNTPQVLLGVELDLDDEMGTCLLSDEQLKMVDYVIGSVHHQPNGFLEFPGIEEEDIEEFFESFRNILINSFKKIPIDIWGHPFLQEFEYYGDKYWQNHIQPIYLECLDVCAEQNIAIELTRSYNKKCLKQPSTFKVLDEMYQLAMQNNEIMFSTGSDSHLRANLGDISIPFQYIKKFNIPNSRILEIYKK